FRERIAAYMHKATKEAKVHTSWVNANEEYDAAVRDFVWRVLPGSGPDLEDPFLVDLLELQRRVAFYGYFNSLAQVVLKCTCPGVPDFYQGMELWELSLVDPDNRRPVDYARRRDLLAGLKQSTAALGDDLTPLMGELLASLPDGRIKLYVTWRALACRQQHARLFDEGTYQPLEVDGAKKDHVCSFSRVLDGETVLIVVPRLLVGLMGGAERPPVGEAVWHDTSLLLPVEEKGRRYRNAFTAETFTVGERDGKPGLGLAEILGSFPVALLTRLAGG
ncbi:MAG TPA: hypothetical protein VKD72_12905, partial [Gemmataceae bacterium]|nr:hypothetical protein [Gemmataceae bacterium]